MAKAAIGRPQTYKPEQIAEMVSDFAKFINENEDPRIVHFTSTYNKYTINKDYISDHAEFSELRKKAIEKQEDYLLRGATKNELNPMFSLFRLKQPQHGYKDRTEQEHSGSVNVIPILGGASTKEKQDDNQKEH